MQPTLEEMRQWPPDEIHGAILVALPPECRFELTDEGGQWRARFFGPDGAVLWWNTYGDPQVLLFDAYGWLWMRRQKPKHPAWKPRTSRTLVPVYGSTAHGPSVPDPEDLNPAEIDTVYSEHSKR